MPETRDRFFCSLASRANCELLAGTVARIRSWLLIEYSGAWRRNAVADSLLFSPAVKAHLRSMRRGAYAPGSPDALPELAGSGDVCRFFG